TTSGGRQHDRAGAFAAWSKRALEILQRAWVLLRDHIPGKTRAFGKVLWKSVRGYRIKNRAHAVNQYLIVMTGDQVPDFLPFAKHLRRCVQNVPQPQSGASPTPAQRFQPGLELATGAERMLVDKHDVRLEGFDGAQQES